MKRYEYCIVYGDDDLQAVKAADKTGIIATDENYLKVFNILGSLGWHLVLNVPNVSKFAPQKNFYYLEREV